MEGIRELSDAAVRSCGGFQGSFGPTIGNVNISFDWNTATDAISNAVANNGFSLATGSYVVDDVSGFWAFQAAFFDNGAG